MNNLLYSSVCMILLLLISVQAVAKTKFDKSTPLEGVENLDFTPAGKVFSHDNQLFALFVLPPQPFEGDGETYYDAKILIWDTKTGKLKYQTTIPSYMNYASHEDIGIEFAADNKTIYATDGARADFFVWNFEQEDHARILCELGDMSEFEHVKAVSADKTIYLIEGLNYLQLCTTRLNAQHYESYGTREPPGVRDTINFLVGNKLLVIHNAHSDVTKDPSFSPEHKNDDFASYWDLGFNFKANEKIKVFDRKKELFLILEISEDKVVFNQWNYMSRERLPTQVISDVEINLASPMFGQDHEAHLFDKYLLVTGKKLDHLTLFEREGTQFSHMWTKDIGKPDTYRDGLYLTSDGKHLVFYWLYYGETNDLGRQVKTSNLVLTDLLSGDEISNYSTGNDEAKDFVLIEPKLSSGLFHKRKAGRESKRCQSKGQQTNLLSLNPDEVSQVLHGEVLAASPNGDALAVCKDKRLFIYQRTEDK